MTVLIAYLILAVVVGYFANQRGRNGGVWFIISILTTPLLGLLLVVVMPNLEAREQARILEERRHKETLEAIREARK